MGGHSGDSKAERLSIAAVNELDAATFAARFGAVYEHSTWVAERARHARPFASRAALERAMQEAVQSAGKGPQLALLRAHPRLGTRKELSGHSRNEQAGAGLLSADTAQLQELHELNRRYEEKFGFPFILAVRNASVPQILDSCRVRVEHAASSEFDESLRQVFTIAHFRLSDLVDDGSRTR